MKRILIALALCGLALPAQAAQIKVCASGCAFTNSQLQAALDSAVGGDEVLLQAGFLYVGTFLMKIHTGATDVTIRTGVSSTGTVLSTGLFPAANIRITPALAASSTFAKIQSNVVNVAGLGTADPVGGVPPGHWKVQWLEGLWNNGTSPGSGTIWSCGSDSNTVQTVNAEVPSDFTYDQVYLHGDPVKGQFRGFSAHCNNLVFKSSDISDIKAMSEQQAWFGNSFEHDHTVTNNHIEGGTEVVFYGGSSGCCRPNVTIASASSSTAMVLSLHTDLHVGQGLTVETVSSAIEEYTEVVSCGTSTVGAVCTSNTITVSPALSGTPVVGADVDWGLVYTNITFTKNWINRPVSQRNAILGAPQGVLATAATSGGTLAAGNYAYRVVARMATAGYPATVSNIARSAASTEATSTTTGTTSKVTIGWAAVTNAESYKVYGRSAGGENTYWTVLASACVGSACSYVDTGTAGTAEAVPTSAGSGWQVKNLVEFKIGENITIEGNVIDGNWADAQTGYCCIVTVANQSSGNDSTRIRNYIFRNNIVRNTAGGFQITGRDVVAGTVTSGRTMNVTIQNNLLYGMGTAWGASVRTVLFTTKGLFAGYPTNPPMGPYGVVIKHNTFIQTGGNALLYFDLLKGTREEPCENCSYENNIGYKLGFGLTGTNNCTQGDGCWTLHNTGTTSYLKNVTADCSPVSSYPGGSAQNYCPTSTALAAEFVDVAAENFALKATSAYHNAGSDGTDIGVNMALVTPFTNVALSGDNTGVAPVIPPAIVTFSLPAGQANTVYTADLTGTCPATPCTWSTTGTLVANTTLSTVSSTTARLDGTPLTGGTFEFIVTLTDVGGRVGTQAYAVTIANAPPPDPDTIPLLPRASAYNLDEGVHWRDPIDPVVRSKPVRVGDIWGDLSVDPSRLRYAQSLSPTAVWETLATATDLTTLSATNLTTGTLPDAVFPATLPAASGINLTALNATNLGSGTVPQARLGASGTRDATTFLRGDNVFAVPAGGASAARVSGMFDAQATSAGAWALTTTPNELFNSVSNRVRADLTGMTQCRIWARSAAAYANSTVTMEYSTTDNTANFVTTNVVADLTSDYGTNYLLSAYFTIPAGAQAETWLRLMGVTSSGTTSPVLRNVGFLCKP